MSLALCPRSTSADSSFVFLYGSQLFLLTLYSIILLGMTLLLCAKAYNSRIGWWIPVVVVFSVACCFIGPMIDGDFVPGIILGVIVLVIEILIFAGVKYEIKGNQLGVRNFFRWTWFPIDKISEVKRQRSILAAAALSFDRLAIKFSDKSILKSSMPLEISPKDITRFIADLKKVNPNIRIKV